MDGRKRGRHGGSHNSNGAFKRPRQEMDSTGIGSKSKPCTKFFSTSGCPFGESCHFLHHVPGGYNAVAQMMNLPPISKVPPPHLQSPHGSAATAKTRMCTKFNTAEGCKFGDKCHFAHGERELNRPIAPSFEDPRAMGAPMHGRYGGRFEPPAPIDTGFGATTFKISVKANLVGAILGKGGVNSKQICRETGVKLAIRDHETDTNLKNIELQGTFVEVNIATAMVRNLVASVSASAPSKGHGGPAPAHGPQSNSYKTKLCENFTKGTCTFGDKCHFAHGAAELRKSGV